eukprot:1289442-Pyramimonas_sp.AAC.1
MANVSRAPARVRICKCSVCPVPGFHGIPVPVLKFRRPSVLMLRSLGPNSAGLRSEFCGHIGGIPGSCSEFSRHPTPLVCSRRR